MDVKRHNGMGPLTSEEKRLYESNLSKYKDERDAIQKKTFTKWVNKHLKKANRHITDLFTDLQDGLNLISLLEVLSGEQLHREKGRMRFHALQNVELVLNFLRYKKIKLVNIRPEDIVDGNPKLTLGLIWTIILHFQISDIVVGEEPNVSARDVLLRWARKSTSRYPGVKVTDFTSSWRDGLAFNALIHRNRPDLIDWQHVRQRNVRERLETAFHSAEKVGVTRLLDPEDVDTHEIDEKSIITYISSMYDVFPEPPQAHPLYDNEGHSLTNEYRDVASSIHLWIREKTSYFSDRSVPNNFDSLLKLSQDVQKFKTVEVPQRAGQRMELNRLYTDLQKIYESTGEVDIEPELHVDVLERGWNKLMSLHEEREHQLQEELKKYEKFDRLAERCSRDIKRLDGRLDDVESRLKEEARRLERLHPMDAKRNADAIESELRAVEESLQSVSRDVATLKSVNHVTAPNLEKKLSKVHQKWVSLRAALHQKLISRLASLSFPVVEERTVTRQTRTVLETRLVDTNHHFRSLQQAIDWCKQKLKQLQETELGNDVPGTKIELAHHQREHKEIDKFQSTVDQCVAAKNQFQGEEQNLYSQHLSGLHKAYSELLTFSTKRMSDLESLLDFLNSAQNLLNWLTGKENIEVARDWSDPNINLQAVEQYHETLMSELEKREVSVRAVIERGNSLALQGHPGAKTISRWTELMKETWSRLLQFSLACEIHTEATRKYQEFMKDLREAEAWLASRDELLNTVYSASEFSLDEGERLLKGMQELREELNKRASAFAELASRAPSIPPIKARRQPVTRPIQINAVCNYSSQEDQVFIEKDDVWLLHDNSALTHWRVSNLSRASQDTNVPSVAFLIPPPGKEPLEGAERLNRAFERTTSLWQRKQMRLRQNMIFATIRVVRSWDLAQFVGMGSEQRSAIRRALNEDADKLLSEGDPGDPQLRRLRREMDEVNRLFDEFERRARQEDEQKTALREFNEMVTTVQTNLDEFERALNQRLVSPIPRDPHSLERLVLQHKTFETELKALTPQIDGLQSALNSLPRKPPQAANKVESLLQQWNSIWNYSHLYVERLKCVEIVLASLDEAKNVVSELEIKLAGFGELPSELEPLRLLHDDLIRVQNAIAARQPVVDQLIDDATNVRRLVVKSRERTTEREHHDLDRLDEDVNMVTRRWNDLCANLVERLRSCEQAGALLDNFGQTYQTEIKFIDESYQQLNSLPPVSQAKHHVEPTKVLFTSIVERTQPLEQVNIDGGRFIREAKQAAEEKYKFCHDSFRQLFDWLAEVESRLAAQQPASESVDGLRNQINVLKLIKEELDSQFKMVTSVQDDARAVISTGGEFFTRDEISTLEKASKNLKTRYDRALATTEKLLKRLGSAGDELKKFRSETQIFSDWLEKAKKTASDREKSATLSLRNESMGDFLSDVISHQADLRFITMAAQKFSDESKEYLNAVNEFRGALMTRPGLIEPPVTSELKQLVTRLTSEYKELLARVSALSDRMSTLGSKTKEYKSALERARQWMSTAEPSANKVLSESLGADPSSLDEQLSRCKILYTEFTAQSRLFDQLKAALDALVRSLDPDRARTEAKELTRPVDELVTRYETLHGALKSRISSLQNALEASQGVESSLEQVLAWLNTAENNIKTLSRPASLIKPRLDEQVRNARAPLADIEEKKPTVESVAFQAKQLVASATNPRLAKRIESKLRDMQTRYEKLLERTLKLNESLNEVSKSLDDFDHRARDIEKWLVDTTETVNMGGPGAAEAAAVERDAKKDSIEKLLRDGRNLVSRKDVTDTSAVRDVIKNIESQFRDLSNLIDEKSRLARLRSEQSLSYEKLKEQILAWIAAFENRLSHLEPVALHADILKRQTDEIKPLVKEHRDYAINIDKLYELGAGLETLDRPESPVRRVSSPIKRLSTTLGRRSSQELTSPSPTKFFAASPVSPAASSGFGSRRSSSSQDVLGTPTGMSVTARETLEIAEAYTSIGTRLSERSAELDQTREELKRAQEQMKTLEGFIERTSRNLPRESLPGNREEADKLNKIVKGLLEDMYEKQYLLDNTKTTVNELLRRKAAAPGSEALERQLNELSTKWKSLYDICKLRVTLFEDLKDLYDTLDHLTGWLSAKERLVNALGPISSDPRMVASQVEQVQVLREEMRATRPQLDHLEETTRSLAARANWHALESKLNQIQERWNSLAKKLDDRAACLGAAADSSREFDSGLSRLRDTLQNISDQIDSASDEKDPEQVLRKLNACDRQLEGARQLLADAEAAGEQLCSVLTDPGSRAEIQSKLAAVNKQYNQLQSKLDQRKAEIEGYLKDGRELDLELAKTVGWLGEELASLNNERLLVSADKDQLIAQVETHEPIYKEVLGREHQIVMLLDKAQGLLKTSEKAQYRNLESLRFQWDKLKKEVVDRHTRLHTSLEHCRKYYKSYDSFLPWLNQCEVKFDSLSPESFSRRELDKHLRDLASFRNDIWKKSGEFEHLRSLSETFLGSCDVDKERVTREMQNVKNRWDRLNQDLLNRTTALEEIGRKIADASDRLRSLAHSVQRCEDRLGSHDTLAGNSDPAQLARLAGIKDEVLSLAAPLDSLGHTCAEIDEEISLVANSRVKSSGLSEEVQALRERLEDLSSRLSDRVDRAQSAAKAVQQYNDKVKLIVTDLSALEDELAQMKPPGRDMKTLRSQQDHLSSFNSKVNRAGDEVAVMASLADSLIDSGFSPDVTRQQAEAVNKRLANLESASRKREEQLDRAVDKLKNFLDSIQEADNLLGVALDEVKRLKPVGSEPEVIRSQQEETRRLREEVVEPAGAAVDASLALGQELVASAAPGVSTNAVEKECERLTDRWSSLKEKMIDRERRLDVGLLQSGKFQEAVEGLSKWLTDTEEMVANQKPPSSDYKVVKAQLQEQKFLKKMLVDRQGSMSSLVAMGREVAANCDASERAGIEKQLRSLADRFDDLTERADARTSQLEQAMAVAKEFHDKLRPIVDWLDRSEKKIRDMELVPTDEEKITQKIREHSALHDDILRKKPALSELTEIAGELAGLVGDDEASAVADRVQELADRYSDLVNRSEGVGSLLENARARLRHLVVSYQKLQGWMQNMESRLAKYKVLAVHTEQLLAQMEDLADLTEEISNEQSTVDSTVDAGLELMKNISSDEAIQLKDKLDSLQRRYNELTSRGADLLKSTETALPLVQQFHGAHNRLSDWMHSAEATLQSADLREDAVQTLEVDVQEFRPVLENINQLGPQVCAIGPGEGAATIEGLVTRDNRRFDAIAQEVRRRAERVRASKQRSAEVLGDVDSLLEWFREVDAQLREAEAPSSEPHVIRLQLKEHKALNDDIAAQKGRVRDVLDTAKRLLRETAQFEDGSSAGIMRDKMADLRETMDSVWTASGERLGLLESALGLAVHFDSSHSELVSWLEEKEREAKSLRPSVLRPQALIQDQAVTQRLLQSISEHKPLVDKLNKTGEALIQVVQHEEGIKVQELLDSDNARYDDLKKLLKNRQDALEKALQESSEFSDKLEGMLRALTNAHDEMASAEPVSSHPPKIRQQLKENDSLMDDVAKREDAFEAIKKAARDVIAKSPNDPAIKDIKRKMDKLETLWNDVRDATKSRKRSLDEALDVASKFWNQLESVVNALAEIEANLLAQEPPALKPNEVQMQTVQLQNIGTEIEETKPRVDEVRRTGAKLMNLVGDSEKPEVRKNIEDMDSAWDTVTSLFAKRRENLITAMEVAMEFHENLRSINEALDKGEARFAGLGPLGEDIGTIRRQMNDVKDLKAFLDPMMVKVESLNRQAAELFERSSADQAQGLKEAVYLVNSRWDDLQRGMAERNRQLENALLRLGQFQQALQELLAWIAATDRSLDTDLSPTAVDTHLLEIQLAKLKVLMNDMAAHQTSVEALNDAGRQIIEEGRSKSDSDSIQEKLADLNSKWKKLMNKASERQTELEEALRQSHRFAAEIQDTLTWLGEIDSVMAASKPVGGLPETAAEQLDRFMVVYNELEEARPRVEAVLARGAERLKKSASAESSAHLAASLKTLKSRWESVTARANDKKIKLEIALKEAREFHDALQNFVDWLTSAEKTLSNLKPVSRVLETILGQIEEHKSFQKEVGTHREAMVQLDRQGTHLKYFCQKQDVILIKNLLVSVQHRWERVVSKSAERTRALDHGYKEAKDYHDSWFSLMSWLTDASTQLDAALREESSRTEEPAALKSRLSAHRELQKAVAAKQPSYDSVMRMGKALRDKAPKNDESALKSMAAELKELWNSVCSKAVERQRNLEEALLYCGQVKDALEALLEWLRRTHKELAEDGLVHGDLDTVQMLIEGHKKLEQELENRRPQVESVERSGRELSNKSESRAMSEQISEMGDLWRKTTELARKRGIKLQNALKQAEELHKAVHMLLEWLSDAEMKLRFVDSLPDDESETRVQISEHEKFLRELNDKEREKDSTIRLAEEILSKAHPDGASVVKHWITIIQSRWEEVSSWAKQRRDMLQTQLRALQDMDSLLAELLAWLADKEATLASQEVTPLPDTIPATQRLIDEHTLFMEDMAKRTHEVDTVIKAKTVKERKQSKKTSETRQSSSELHELQRKQSISLRSSREALDRRGSRSSPTKDVVDSTLPHIGPKFPAKGSKTPEPQFKCTRSRQLYDRWRSVWLMAWERQRRLRDHLAHLGELERLANFSWDEWRKRFLRFMNHKKSRLTDLFRKMDKNNDGLIPRDDFIDGIIKTKFDTSKLEMGAVADMFDHNAVGLIDWKEFIAALRPDWEERKPDTEAEKIHDEVKRLVMLCTCRQKFRVFQVGEGKYRFGDSQKLRLVRILRSTVMVRVGGGWVALEEFLVKNDPCRAKGRTNIELREQFILADNVSQSMSAFKPKLSTERRTPTPTSSTGPITKIREKSTRSVPMTTRGTPTAGSRGSRGSAGSLSDVDSVSAPMTPSFRKSSLRTPVSTLGGGSLPGSRSSSRQGSKPPSRHGSSLSLASSDDGGGATTPSSSRIPRRSAPSRTGSSASTSQATAQRRATAPSTPRTPKTPSSAGRK